MDWYRVRVNGVEGWVSSRYTSLNGGGWTWDEGDVRYVRATARVNVRSGPGANYEDLGTLARGECLTYLGETRYDAGGQAWYKAQYYSYGEVWVSATYSELTWTYTDAASDDDAGVSGNYIEATGSLNVRSGPRPGLLGQGHAAKGRHRRLPGRILGGRARRDLVQGLLQRRQRLGVPPATASSTDRQKQRPGRKPRALRALTKPTTAKIALIYKKSEAIFASGGGFVEPFGIVKSSRPWRQILPPAKFPRQLHLHPAVTYV